MEYTPCKRQYTGKSETAFNNRLNNHLKTYTKQTSQKQPFFETAVDSLGIKENVSVLDISINSEDPVDIAIIKYREHPSIIKITENVF